MTQKFEDQIKDMTDEQLSGKINELADKMRESIALGNPMEIAQQIRIANAELNRRTTNGEKQ